MRQALGIPEDAFIYLNVGRLDPQKGQSFLLEAFKDVISEVPNSYLVIIGSGSLEAALKAQAESLNVSDRVRFLFNKKNIGAHLEMADVFVFPSLFEGLPLALLEAMTKGLPCIVSSIQPHLEVVNDKVSGLIISPECKEALAGAMVELYQQPALREQLGRKAAEKMESAFFSEVLKSKWEELYSGITSVKNNNRSSPVSS